MPRLEKKKEEVTEGTSDQQKRWTSMEISGGVRSLSPELFTFHHLTTLFLNNNFLEKIPPDIIRLQHLHILDISSNKLREVPSELCQLMQLRKLHLCDNNLEFLPYELSKLINLEVLSLQGNPLSNEIRTIYNDSNDTGKLLLYFKYKLTAPPPPRSWIPLMLPNRSRPACKFSIMTYNVLCDKYASRKKYWYCPYFDLFWENRKKALLDEIRHYSADFICLQEVQTEHFHNFFFPELKQNGYDAVFSAKSRVKTMPASKRKYVDGCAIFFKRKKFSLLKAHVIEFNQLAMANREGSKDMLNRVMPKDNIGLAVLIKTNEAAWEDGIPSDRGQIILVCTTHIHNSPMNSDVKLMQAIMLSNELRSILDETARDLHLNYDQDRGQLLLCGDFNSLPNSGVVEFLSSGRVPANHRDFKDLDYASLQTMIDSNKYFTHSLNLASVFNEDIMPCTNYTNKFKTMIDYIFYAKQYMTPVALLGPISQNWFREHNIEGCPNPHIPSDHFPLLVQLEISPPTRVKWNSLIDRNREPLLGVLRSFEHIHDINPRRGGHKRGQC